MYGRLRGTAGRIPEPLSTSNKYTPNVDDLAGDIIVRVTPRASSGQVGETKGASPSSPIALPGNVHSMLRDWIDIGQKSFVNCFEGEKERQLLFTRDKLKVRDKAGKTLAKSEGYANVAVRLDPRQAYSFVIDIGTKKRGTSDSFRLTCRREGERDLIKLALQAFANPSTLESMPVAPTSASSSLHLAAVGGLTNPKAEGVSPASSQTSEQQSLADVDERASAIGSASAALPKPSGSNKLATSGRKLSFTRQLMKGGKK